MGKKCIMSLCDFSPATFYCTCPQDHEVHIQYCTTIILPKISFKQILSKLVQL